MAWFKRRAERPRAPSIFERLERAGPEESAAPSPDDPSAHRWARGEGDVYLTFRVGATEPSAAAAGDLAFSELVGAMHDEVREPTGATRVALDIAIEAFEPATHMDRLVDAVVMGGGFEPLALYDLVRRLATEGTTPKQVQVGAALMGLFTDPDDDEILRVLARSPTYSVYAAVALTNRLGPFATLADRQRLWSELAQKSAGWARALLVERVCAEPVTEEPLRSWLLAEGWRSGPGTERAAAPVARAVRLLDLAREADLDHDRFVAACALLAAVGSAEGFAGAAEIREALLALSPRLARPEDAAQLEALRAQRSTG